MSEVGFTISKDYAWVLLSVAWMGFQCVIHGFIYPGKARFTYFTKDFLNKNYGEEHKKLTGYEFKRGGGYPDTGSGLYSQKLSYGDWFKYNNLQRIHLNYVEGLATIIILTLVAGVYSPYWGAIFGAAYIVGRQLVAFGYSSTGVTHPLRRLGIITCDISILANFFISNVGIYKIVPTDC